MLAALALPASAAAETERDWTQRALALQYELASDVPLRNAPWVYTHNAYNSRAEMGPTLSALDQNHQISIVDQLNEGVRHLEIDTHLFRGRPVVCHAADLHAGCSVEKPLTTVLAEIRGWMNSHPDQVLMLYLESHLDSESGYNQGAEIVQAALGDVLVRPPGGGSRCAPMPLTLSRDAIRRSGKRVLIIGPCGIGTRWQGLVFDEELRDTGSDNAPFRPFPDCGPDFKRRDYDRKVIRYYEDATQLTRATNAGETDPITPALAGRMTRCGVDIIGLDMLVQGDPRLTALVWSWARGEPRSAGSCSVQLLDGRWKARSCAERHPAACRDGSGAWLISQRSLSAGEAPHLCGSKRWLHALPRTGYEGQLLREAMKRSGAKVAWLGQRRDGSAWNPREVRGCGPRQRRPRRRFPVENGVARVVLRLRFACTGKRLRARISARSALGGRVRGRTGKRLRVPVRAGQRKLKVRFRHLGKRRTATVLLAATRR